MHSITSTPGALRLFAISVLARLPLPTFSIGLLVHARHLTGSFAAAGVVAGSYGAALGIGGPFLGRLVDRCGQTGVLLASAAASALLLGAIALMPADAPVPALVALAFGIGLASPPLGACLRTALPRILADQKAVRASYTLDATASELTWILGPPLVIALGAATSTGTALAVSGIVLLAATAAFAAEPASRGWRPSGDGVRARGGCLRAPAMRTLVLVLIAVGVLFGAVEVGVTAAAAGLGSTASAGPLLGLWGAGSLIGGLAAVRVGAGLRGASRLALVLAALACGHLLLVAAAGSIVAMAAVLVLGGTAIAPTYAVVYAMVDDAAPAGTETEAFAWLGTAVAIGAAAGSAVAGAAADHAGPGAAFALAAAGGAVAVALVIVRASSFPPAKSQRQAEVDARALPAVSPG
ncbi:MAG TPA: MFS transporter [Gaiellales bacterium]|nr:MFS transporter [Gaiellales bacterium]